MTGANHGRVHRALVDFIRLTPERAGIPLVKEPLEYPGHEVPIRDPDARCRPWPPDVRCRRRLHKAFCRWYAANQENFAIKLELLKRTDTYLDIGFCRISRVVTASLTTWEINVDVEWRGTAWDMLISLEARAKRVPGGYVCDLCPEGDRPIFSSREAVW